MHVPAQRTFYYMDMLDYSDYRPDTPMSLDRLATETYGRTYVGQQTGKMLPNDTDHIYVMDENSIADLGLDDRIDYVSRDGDTTFTLANWLAAPDGKYDFEHYRSGPTPETMLAHLVRDGHLPYGTYLLRVSW